MTPQDLRGLSLLIGLMYSLDLFSAFMSSPWSTEAFGADAARAASARRLVAISIVTALVAGGMASYLDKNPWPIIGAGGGAATMWWLYEDALARGQAKGYQGVDLGSS